MKMVVVVFWGPAGSWSWELGMKSHVAAGSPRGYPYLDLLKESLMCLLRPWRARPTSQLVGLMHEI